MRSISVFLLLLLALPLAACGHRSSADVTPVTTGAAAPAGQRAARDVVVTEGDITDRRYRTLGDVSVRVSKNTLFDADPTTELVAAKLQEEAAKLGADAVVLVRYGAPGMTLTSWGSMEGKGRAVAFVP